MMTQTACYCSTTDGSHAMNCPLRPAVTIYPIYQIFYPYGVPAPAPMGWLCPRCGAGVAPHTAKCPCNETTVTISWNGLPRN